MLDCYTPKNSSVVYNRITVFTIDALGHLFLFIPPFIGIIASVDTLASPSPIRQLIHCYSVVVAFSRDGNVVVYNALKQRHKIQWV